MQLGDSRRVVCSLTYADNDAAIERLVRDSRDQPAGKSNPSDMCTIRVLAADSRRPSGCSTCVMSLVQGFDVAPGAVHQHDEVSGRRESRPPALAEPDVNLSTHPAPIAQPSGRAPRRQCANSRGNRLAISASHAIARRSLLRSRLSYFRVAQRTRWLLSLRRK